jgi:hypothetical protein
MRLRRDTNALNGGDRHIKRASNRHQARVIAGQLHGLALRPKKLDGPKMEGVQCANGDGKWLQRSGQYSFAHLDEAHPGQQTACSAAKWNHQPVGIDPVPDLIGQQSA